VKAVRDDPCALPARLLAQRIARRRLSAVEVLEAHLLRIEKHNPSLRAVVSLDAERARTLARAADAAPRRGAVRGPLHGVPITLKDGHDVAGLRTTAGTPVLDRVPQEDGTVAARLRAAGAIIVGHTNVPPWLGDYQSANPIFGRAANPWDRGRTPGGSSGGAAAAVAASLTPLDVGTDLAGSIRLPAHFCGVYGLKTSERVVPSTGFLRPPDGMPRPVRIMSCIGPLARDLGDLDLALRIIAGPDGRDGEVAPVPLPARRNLRLRGLRLAVAPVVPGAAVESAIQARIERLAKDAAQAGARVHDRLPDLDWNELTTLFGDLVSTVVGLFDPQAKLRDEQRTLAWYLAALQRRDAMTAAWQRYFEDVDALILPSALTAAFTHRDTGSTLEVDGKTVGYWGHGRVLGIFNLTGLPALAVPAGLDQRGLPIGVQIVGPLWSDVRLLDVARALEREGVLPGFQPPPLG
jgi:amidase